MSENFDGDEPLMIETATSKDYNDFWENDGISMVGNPMGAEPSADTINFQSSDCCAAAPSVPIMIVLCAEGQDHISFDTGTLNLNVPVEKKKSMYKYNEDRYP